MMIKQQENTKSPCPPFTKGGQGGISSGSGFTLIELMITMVVFVLFSIAASQIFTGLLTQFKQQSKLAETNIEGMVGLEILRRDIAGAGYGLPWTGLITYSETTTNPFGLDDATTGVPKAILSKNDATFASPNNIFNNSDYLIIRSLNIARNNSSDKWTTLAYASPYVRTWVPATENLQNTDRVIVLSMGGSGATRGLVVNGTAFSTTFSSVTSSPWRSADPTDTRLVYGVDPDTNLRMPFNRADYFISSTNPPSRCAPNTGVLEKATVNQSDGRFTYLPLLDCVADMQIVYGLDLDSDGDFEPGVAGSTDGYSEDITALTAQQIREQVKQVRVYVLAHEGQKDLTYLYPSSTIDVGGDIGLGRTFNFATRIGNPDYKYYRWKLYSIVVTPNNLE
jgi:prepilin-type N-terminal cleavage/methylation domain-containing protein